MDAITAVALVESSMQGAALLLPKDVDTLHAPFPANPIISYLQLAKTILQKLDLQHIFNSEQEKYRNHLNNTNSRNEKNLNHDINEFINENNINLTNVATEANHCNNDKIENNQNQEPSNNKKKFQTNTIDTSISQIERKINTINVEPKKRRSNATLKNSTKKQKIESDNNLDILNLVPSVNDEILEDIDIDLDLVSSFVLDDNQSEFISSTQKEGIFKKKVSDLHEKFDFKISKEKTKILHIEKSQISASNDSVILSEQNINLLQTEGSRTNVPNKFQSENCSVGANLSSEFNKNQNLNETNSINTTETVLNNSENTIAQETNSETFPLNKQPNIRKSLAIFAFKKSEVKVDKNEVDNADSQSETCSQLSSKTIFQSQEDDFDLNI